MDKKLKYYVKKGHRSVEGWLTTVALKAIIEIASVQEKESIKGPVCEVGVHHGRLFILLHLITAKNEISAAWDLFQNQHENTENSGKGDRHMLLKNLVKHGCDTARITIRAKNSLHLTSEEIMETCGGRPRLFSVDGGHTAEITYNDLSIAASSLCNGGVIILDDFFNEAWPGVAEGTCRYMFENPELSAVAIVGNKIMFTNSASAAGKYITGINFTHAGYLSKMTRFFERDVVCYRPIKTNFIWKHLRDRPTGRLLKRVLKRS